jgi:hypothetical protein
VGKFTASEKVLVKSLVGALTIKRMPESEIIKEIYNQTNKTITNLALWKIRQRIKKESYHWHKSMREGEYEYLHEFKERIKETELPELFLILKKLNV